MCVLANKSEPLIGMSRALAFSPRKGEFLAVGIGGRLANRRSGNFGKHAGKVVMMATKNLKTLSTFKVAKEMISDMLRQDVGQKQLVEPKFTVDLFFFFPSFQATEEVHAEVPLDLFEKKSFSIKKLNTITCVSLKPLCLIFLALKLPADPRPIT